MSKYYVFIFQFDTGSRGDWIGASQLHTKIVEGVDNLDSYLYSLCDQYFGEYFDSENFDDFSDVGKDYAYFDNESEENQSICILPTLDRMKEELDWLGQGFWQDWENKKHGFLKQFEREWWINNKPGDNNGITINS